ncbi:hypothetical protein ACFLS9_09355, partial [Bacteroidota bacterium]
MKIKKAIQYTTFALLLCIENLYAQDFKISPNTPVPEVHEFHDVWVTASETNGFLVTWCSDYRVGNMTAKDNYACRISNTGEILDNIAINIGGEPIWFWNCLSAVFLNGNWIIASQQDYFHEWVGVVRLSPSGEVLDSLPVNIFNSIGWAYLRYPVIETNGQEILCVAGIEDEGLYGSIFDSDLNILVERFLILADADAETAYRISANGNNFFITWLNWGDPSDSKIKLAIVNPAGEILSIQNVNEEWWLFKKRGAPTITTLNDTTYITYFENSALNIRRYSSSGNPIDSEAVKIFESQDIDPILSETCFGVWAIAYTELVWANKYFRFFWPGVSEPGISMWSFKSDLSMSNNQPVLLNSQCQIEFHYDQFGYSDSRSIIRGAAIGDTVLTAWIDGREEYPRVYGNMFDINA